MSAKSIQILEKLNSMMVEKFNFEISADTKISKAPLDSLDYIELIIDIEEEYGIDIDETVSDKFRTFGDVVKHIQDVTSVEKT